MERITVILPIHTLNDGLGGLVEKAIKSVPQEINLVVVTAPDIKSSVEETAIKTHGDRTIVVANDNTELVPMINRGLQEVKTDYFSILEADDEYTGIWFKNVVRYINEKPNVFCFMPLTHIVDEKGDFTAFVNEAPLALNFSDRLGYVTYDSLQVYMAYNLTGAVFNVADWESVGGLKDNIKYSFWFEFMLRATRADYDFLVVPKIGYRHLIGRPGSMFAISKDTMSQNELDYWYNVALDEHEFHDARDVEPYKSQSII